MMKKVCALRMSDNQGVCEPGIAIREAVLYLSEIDLAQCRRLRYAPVFALYQHPQSHLGLFCIFYHKAHNACLHLPAELRNTYKRKVIG